MYSLANNNTVNGTLNKIIVETIQLLSYYSYYITIIYKYLFILMKCNHQM